VRLLLIALRNLDRNRRRSLLSLLVVAAGTAALVLTAGFMRFSFDGLREALVRSGLGHLEVAPEGGGVAGESPGGGGAAPALEGWEALRAELEAIPHVRAVGAALQVTGIVSHGERTAAVLGLAVEPDRERRMGVEVKLRGGAGLPEAAPAEGEDQALLGVGLARALEAAPGDVVTVTGITVDGTLNALDLKVAGLVTSGLRELDARLLKVHLATAQRLLATDRVASLVVGLDDTARTAAVRGQVEERLPQGLKVRDWESRAPFYEQVRALYGGIFWFLGVIVMVLVALAASNTLLMSLLERMREVGTLLALGTSRGQVAALVVAEAGWLGVLGSAAGSGLGLALAVALNAAHVRMPPPPGAADPLDLRLLVQPADVLGITVLMVATLLTASVVPAVRALRVRIVDALGHV
jgi:putative ABC transport system permease protein